MSIVIFRGFWVVGSWLHSQGVVGIFQNSKFLLKSFRILYFIYKTFLNLTFSFLRNAVLPILKFYHLKFETRVHNLVSLSELVSCREHHMIRLVQDLAKLYCCICQYPITVRSYYDIKVTKIL